MNTPGPIDYRPEPPRTPPRRVSRHVAPLLLLLATILAGLTGCLQPTRLLPDSSLVTPTAPDRPRATPVATIAGPPMPTPIPPPTGLVPARTIVFVSDRDGQIDLYLTDIETGRLVRLTNDRAIESFPTWSPDGTSIAYVVEDERAVRNLWLLDLRTGMHRQLTHEEPPFDVRRPAWLRGGQILIYDTGKPFDRRPELRAITIDGQRLSPLVPSDGEVIYDWSTNGETLICAVGQMIGEPRLVVTDAVPGMALTPETGAPLGFAAEISPNGRYATFAGPPLSDDQITALLDLATGTTLPLNAGITGHRYEHDFAWLPDNTRLVLVHGTGGVTDGLGKLKVGPDAPPTSDGTAGLWLISTDATSGALTRRQLTSGSADANPRPSPDGRWIVYLTDTQKPTPLASNIVLIGVDPSPGSQAYVPKNLTGDLGNNWSPVWMPLP